MTMKIKRWMAVSDGLFKMKKSQITMEALLLYGSMILIVLLAIAGLMYFGVLDLGNLLPTKCDVTGTKDFKCTEWQINKDDDCVIFVLKNTATLTLTVSNLTFTSADSGVIGSGTNTSFTSNVVPGGTSTQYICDASINAEKGKRAKGRFSFDYKATDGGVLGTRADGEIIGTIQ